MKCVVVFVLIELSVAEIMIRGAVPIVVIHKLLVSDWKDFLGYEFIIVHSLYHIRNTEAAKKFFHVAQVFAFVLCYFSCDTHNCLVQVGV